MQSYTVERKIGKQSVLLEKTVTLVSSATVAGPKESLGPLSAFFDRSYKDTILKENSFERAECHMMEEACHLALAKAGLSPDDIDYFIAGDLLNQVISASFCARWLAVPFLGIYGACSTLTEGLSIGAMLLQGGLPEIFSWPPPVITAALRGSIAIPQNMVTRGPSMHSGPLLGPVPLY